MATPHPEPVRPARANTAYIRYVTAAKQALCPVDQIRNFLKSQVVLQSRQLDASAAARLCDYDGGPTEIGYGGARGGGKSHWLLAQIGADDCQRFPGLKCLILRKVGKSLKEGVQDLITRALRGVPHKYVASKATIYFPNGSLIILGHFQKESDIDAYLGLEYDVIGVEEATTLSWSKYKAIRTCNRTSKSGWRPRIYTTTNPGGVGHAWYKDLFIEPAVKAAEHDTRFVPATVDDNAFVNREYKANLDKLTGWQLRAWRYGDWDIAAGQYFTNFRRDVHVFEPGKVEIAANWRKWCALDYGWTHFTCAHLLVQDGDGRIFVMDEHCERRWLVKRHAEAIKAMLARNGLAVNNLWKFVAGADVFAKKLEGGTVDEEYRSNGIRLEAANDERISGATEILSRLGDLEATRKNEAGEMEPFPIEPTLYISERCGRLIECLPTLQHNPHSPEDVLKVDCDEDGMGGDDPYDSARYGVMVAVTAPTKTTYRPGMAAVGRAA